MIKRYSFLKEDLNPLAVTAGAAGTAAMIGGLPAVLPAMAAAGIGMGAIGTLKNIKQNRFNNRYLSLMYKELAAAPTREKALEIVNRYSTSLTSMYGNMVNKKMQQRVAIMQNFINLNFRIPLIKIIRNPQDLNWKANALTYFKKNSRKINLKNAAKTALGATSLAAGGAMLGGNLTGMLTPGTAQTLGTVTTSLFWTRAALNQLKTFNSTIYLNRMKAELQNCPDDDRQTAQQILEKYCYDIANNIQGIVNKSKKKINFSIQQDLRNRFLIPCFQIINNPNNKYWKMTLMDYLDTQKLQGIVQNICNSITQILIPRLARSH